MPLKLYLLKIFATDHFVTIGEAFALYWACSRLETSSGPMNILSEGFFDVLRNNSVNRTIFFYKSIICSGISLDVSDSKVVVRRNLRNI